MEEILTAQSQTTKTHLTDKYLKNHVFPDSQAWHEEIVLLDVGRLSSKFRLIYRYIVDSDQTSNFQGFYIPEGHAVEQSCFSGTTRAHQYEQFSRMCNATHWKRTVDIRISKKLLKIPFDFIIGFKHRKYVEHLALDGNFW